MITDIFIKRPVLSFVVSAFILLIGLKSLNSLQLRQYPELTNTLITVSTSYPGASTELMQGFVTSPIQEAVASAEGVDYVISNSTQGLSTVQAYIKLNFPPNQAMTEVMAKTQQVNGVLPRGINTPIITKTTGDSIKILYASFANKNMSNPQITDYIKRKIKPNLATLDGVAAVDILGGQTFAMRVWLEPEKMQAYQISADALTQALAAQNYQSTAGQSKSYFLISNISVNTHLENLSEFENIIIKSENNKIIRLKDVARIQLDAQDYDTVVTMNGKSAVFIGIDNTPSSNPLTVVKAVRQQLDALRNNLPPGMELEIAYDSTEFIKASIEEVIKTLLEASSIVMLVILLFLGNFRAVIISVVTIPLSIIGVTALMLLMGFSINLLTLLAMVLAIGLVVDDAIVVVENVYRHLAQRKTPLEAALIGAREITGPVISMTITLLAVYAPIGFMGGITGTLFSEFALTLAGAVFISGIIALTLSPMMCSKLLKNPEQKKVSLHHRLEAFFNTLIAKYILILKPVLEKPKRVFPIFSLIILGSLIFLKFTPKELAPPEDQGIIFMAGKAPQYANIDYTNAYSNQMIQKLMPLEDKDLLFSIAGTGSQNASFAGLLLKPWNQRENSSEKLLQMVQKKLHEIPGMNFFAFERPPLPSGGSRGLPFQLVVTTLSTYPELYDVMEKLKTAALKTGNFFVVDSDLSFNTPVIKIEINHEKARFMGISMQTIGHSLSTFLGGNYVNLFSMAGKSYQVIPLSPRLKRLGIEEIENLYIYSDDGQFSTKFGNIATISNSQEAAELLQFNQINAATLGAVVAPWAKMSDVMAFFQNYAENNFPLEYSYDYLGEARQYKEEGHALYYTFLFALIIIYLVLAAQFESLRDPFIIMLSVPMSIFGALLILFLGAASLNIYSQIGLVTLIGLITKHGILIVEFANQLQLKNKLSVKSAILKSASIRLRPILMTTAAMVVGLFPLILASGAGATSRFSIAVVIISGMLIGTLFTIFIVPLFYLLISKPKHNA
ncbi:MAG: efflux RND transporter permease subunit [Gammaproteobacteria bacterium]